MSKFKKGDYIVTLKIILQNKFPANCGKENYCFKIRESYKYIRPEIDLTGSNTNGTTTMAFDKSEELRDWRYATDLEAAEYDRIGKPFDVTTLKPKFEVGKWYKLENWITKFEKFDKDEFWGEYINKSSGRHDANGYLSLHTYTPELITDLTEIQQYLPDGHVDKIKTELTINDLVEGEIYYCSSDGGNIYIVESRGGPLMGDSIYVNDHTYSTKLSAIDSRHKLSGLSKWEIRKADSDERQWLEACISANEFLEKDEALNQKPEYVECISHNKDFFGELGKVYEVKSWMHSDNDCLLIGTTTGSCDRSRFKPSTKVVFDAQNSEFVLPEKWCVKTTIETRSVVNKFLNSNKYAGNLNKDYYCHYPLIGSGSAWKTIREGYTEITFDQFKKYVLKDHVVENKKVKFKYGHWYTYGKSNSILCFATQNKCAYGFNSRGKWEEFEGRNFETCPHLWTNASKEEVEARLIEYAKKKYPVGTRFKNKDGVIQSVQLDTHKFYNKGETVNCGGCPRSEWRTGYSNAAIFNEGKWAEIIKEEVKVDSKRAVKFESQAEWDFANKEFKYGNSLKMNESTDSFGKCNYRMANDGAVLSEGYARDQKYKVISFQQWLDEFGHNEAWKKVIDVDFGEVKPEFNRDFYVKVNSQEKADAMFEYLKSKGEVTSHEKCRKDVDKVVTYSKQYNSWICNNSSNAIFERPLSDFINIPASTNDSDPLGIIGKKFTVDHNEIEYLFKSFDIDSYLITFINSNGKKSTTYSSATKAENHIESRKWKIIEDEPLVPRENLYIGGHDLVEGDLSSYLTKLPIVDVGASYQWKLKEHISIVPEPKVQELVDTDKYFPKEEELSLDDLLREV